MSTVLTDYDTWKQFLAERVEQAKSLGLGEDTISKLAYEIGSFLDERVDPKNDEQRAVKELWDVGDEQERQVIAKLMVRLAEQSK
ncbi:DUF3243 domain-containing protein [Paenibacillus sp. SYP-B4298]|uniref:DUF3243 domain-containing protein n=1 Tax=Paenibacillus sp. SYP-B4298 TaxID=2996034 RepID=UPI0022DDEFAE|nr:DUF3243 domain-containing protein [Paenibacillus sp. SYP-B4298]